MTKVAYRARIDYNTDNLLFQYETFKKGVKNRLYYLTSSFDGFNELTVERKEELKKEAILLQKKYCEEKNALCPDYYKVLNCLNNDIQNHTYAPYEAVTLLIETIDPSLKLIKIFLLSKTDFEMDSKSTKELGFYDPKLIDYELAYAKRFNKAKPKSLVFKPENN